MGQITTTENDPGAMTPVDLRHVARSGPGQKPAWAQQSTDLSLNLVSLTAGQGIGSHINTEVDVLLVGIDGRGRVEIDGRWRPVRAGQAVVIPKGRQRAMQSEDDHFAYLTCHRRRAGLMPEM